MTITSLQFLAFCLAAVLLFLIFPRKYRWISLLISSIAFYLISAKAIIVFIAVTSFTIWMAGRKMTCIQQKADNTLKNGDLDRTAKKELKKKTQSCRKRVLLIALVINIGMLVVFKIFNYFTAAFAMIAGLFVGSANADALTVIMPLGISYYTFATIGYLLDVYWKRYESEENFVRFFLFAIYFPHIVQGPISRYPLLGQELKKKELRFTWNNFVIGMESILLGCFKKLVIADRASIFVSSVIQESGLHGSIYLFAMILDGIQIYADFSGYMDIVRGVSRLFDVELEQNFNHPFLAKSVPEFWRRWHMSLGGWFKDYVYYPITVSKTIKKLNKKVRNWKSNHAKNLVIIIIPVMVTWLCTGLWHGTGSGYVMWGIYYGTLIALSVTFGEDIQRFLHKLHINTECFSWRMLQVVKIFCIFMGGRFLGTQMTMTHRGEIFYQIFHSFLGFPVMDYGLDAVNFLILFVGVILLIAIAVIEQKQELFTWFNSQNRLFCAVVLYVIFFAVFLLGIYGSGYDASSFMYQQF